MPVSFDPVFYILLLNHTLAVNPTPLNKKLQSVDIREILQKIRLF